MPYSGFCGPSNILNVPSGKQSVPVITPNPTPLPLRAPYRANAWKCQENHALAVLVTG